MTHINRIASCLFRSAALLTLVAWPTVAAAQAAAVAPSTNVVEVKFTHAGSSGNRHFDVNLAVGQTLKVAVQQTCDAFGITIRGIVRAPTAPPRPSAQAGDPFPLVDKDVSTTHDDQYGGYVVSIERKSGTRACVTDDQLQNRLLFISAKTLDWNVAFAGGFTASSLRDPVFSVRTADDGRERIIEEPGKRDSAALGVAAFVHLFHEKRPSLALSFGLGIREDNKSQYYIGGGYRFGDKATLVGGMVFGPQSRLPNGVALDDEATDANVLGSLGSRTGKGFFVGLSYSFIQVGDRFQKPFAGAGNGGEGQAAESGKKEEAAASCDVGFAVGDTAAPDLSLDATAHEVNVSVKGDAGCEWTVAGDPSAPWLTVAPASVKPGASVKVSVKANDTAAPRKAAVTFTPKGGQAKPLQVVQKAKA